LGAAAAGLVLSLAIWLGFELARFGRPFSSYGKNQRFDNALLDGLWRLTVGPNKGLLLYFPLLLLAVWGVVRMARDRATWGAAAAIGGTSLVIVCLYAKWWAWDGSSGWGPRLIVPTIPLLAAAAGIAATGKLLQRAGWTLLGLGVAM